ncbi:iron chaperone [Aquimarina spongiae]|uniref:Uncharacterized conserved protein YdhG, YjbR/CyaY-like superfamily, DUF1801 family n=1 Tax=Aquimarina spongiae TaxID=570521 RepID=A0A1M6DX08_9FLAO|nr:DUF1801 domain-containing protein [Aquimarina spongiae]SHI77659.1 Uncharacterized conserved protein YdhG, YjbR/CyaY-like superfamily, DUF1801 family [Aquimarina spongiae]
MGKKGAMPNYKTIDHYIDNQSSEAQLILRELRSLIKEAVPEVVEIPNYKVPSFTLIKGIKPEQQLMIAAYTKYVSFYPSEATVNHFAQQLKGFDVGKGTVKFSFNTPLPEELIRQMVKFRHEELQKKQKL